MTALRFLEIRSDATYTDRLEIAGLVAQVPPEVDLPEAPRLSDPVIITQGTVADRPQRIAVMSDSQFVGRDPDSALVAAARRTLREIVAAKPDLLVIDGDFVDEAARSTCSWPSGSWTKRWGRRSRTSMCRATTRSWAARSATSSRSSAPRPPRGTLGRTKIVTLNSSSGTCIRAAAPISSGCWRRQLAAAAADPAITGVLVFQHHPIDDPHPDKASQLSDRYEAAALDRVLDHFQAEHGKSVALINGHVGTFFADASGGASRVINGNSGKGPSGAPDEGGFTGWSLLGVDPGHGTIEPGHSRLDWLRVETRIRVDDINLSAPASMVVGDLKPAGATILQDDDRQVPVTWPVSAEWGGQGVWIGDPERAKPDPKATVAFDPIAGQLIALRPGLAELEVTVNGVTARQSISVD